MQKLTNNEERIVQAIREYTKKHGYAPVVREICILTGLNSTATVHDHMKSLMAKGVIQSEHPGYPRAYRLAKEYKEEDELCS